MDLNLAKIEKFLKNKNINYSIINAPKKHLSFIPASIFHPTDYGFYYLEDKIQIPTVKNSIFFVNSSYSEFFESNCFIIFKSKSQYYYYLLLNYLFKEKSSGMISNLSVLDPAAKIGKNVQIDAFCVIGKAEIGDNCIIKSHTIINDKSIIGENVTIENHSSIGSTGTGWVWENELNPTKINLPQLGGVIIEKNTFLGANTIIVRGSLNENTIIGENCILAPGCKIGHGTKIGKMCHLANNVTTGGNTKIGNFCFMGSSSTTRPQICLNDFTITGVGAVIVKNSSKKGLLLIGVPAREYNPSKTPSGMPKLLNWQKKRK
jgi:UDP-3-O-[3-hydroxymyristoyl] glucosamine N-acyltransferase